MSERGDEGPIGLEGEDSNQGRPALPSAVDGDGEQTNRECDILPSGKTLPPFPFSFKRHRSAPIRSEVRKVARADIYDIFNLGIDLPSFGSLC